MISLKHKVLVVGLGATGLSCVRYLHSIGQSMVVVDTRQMPPLAAKLAATYLDVPLIDPAALEQAIDLPLRVIVSPGVDPALQWIQAFSQKGLTLESDIDLFCENNTRPVIAVTGTNGKSTVVSQLGHIVQTSGKKACVIGNVGYPALDALMDGVVKKADIVVMELSSYQLEMTHKLNPTVACITNVTEDHLDRHLSMENYQRAKHRIYQNAKTIVYNRDDQWTIPEPSMNNTAARISFGFSPEDNSVSLKIVKKEKQVSVMKSGQAILPLCHLPVIGHHHYLNAAACCAIASAIGIDLPSIQQGLESFQHLKHRSQLVGCFHGITFIDDSKGTNIGATEAALATLQEANVPIILLLGGQAKNQDFSTLILHKHPLIKAVIVYGQDKNIIASTLSYKGRQFIENDLRAAIKKAIAVSAVKDIILLSPACASWDEFENFEERGQCFANIATEFAKGKSESFSNAS